MNPRFHKREMRSRRENKTVLGNNNTTGNDGKLMPVSRKSDTQKEKLGKKQRCLLSRQEQTQVKEKCSYEVVV